MWHVDGGGGPIYAKHGSTIQLIGLFYKTTSYWAWARSINHLIHYYFPIYMWIHFAKDMLFQFWPNYFSRLLHSYYLPSGHWLDGRSTNDHQTFFSISDVFLLMGYSVCKWYLCGGDVMRILLALFFFFFQHKQSYVSFYSNLSFDTNVTMVILDNIEPFNHQIDDFPYMHS